MVEEFNAKLANASLRVEELGLTGQKFLLAEPWLDDGIPTIYLYQNNSAQAQVLASIGLKNALTTISEPGGGVTVTVGLEGLSTLDSPDVHFFYRDLDTQSALLNNSIWQNLEFVKNGQVYRLGEGYRFPESISSLQVMIDQLIGALANG
jgi:ferric hydroxamate transport system substrate-binding protein